MSEPTLPTAPRAHQLPPKWDKPPHTWATMVALEKAAYRMGRHDLAAKARKARAAA